MSEPKHEEDDHIVMVYGWGVDDAGAFLSFDGNYGRDGMMRATKALCSGCNVEKKCLVTDQSEGEYNPAMICLDCIEWLFSEPHTDDCSIERKP